jgi:DNA-binding NarL/FixJ family response regulator
MIRVLIIDDEIIITRLIQMLLQKNFDWEVKIAVSVEEAKAEMNAFRPQLVLCDINLGSNIDGIDLISRLQLDFVFDTIYITSYQSEGIIEKASLTRPVNYIIKPINEIQFIATMKMAGGRIALPEKVVPLAKDLLTRSEYEVLQHIVGGLSTQEIAKTLHISPSTAKNHRHNICRKLNLPPGNNAIVRWAMENKDAFAPKA